MSFFSPQAVELLAPAGNADIGIAAIDHGADAVYIGAPRFSARAAAGTALGDIARLVSHAHRFHARVYVALNTLLSDKELPQAVQLIHQLYDAGVDALIIQDLGLLECDLPPLSLHASTQMDNRSVEKVCFLEQAGFDQVVLARELTVQEIQAITAATTITVECFVHGALCVSYSGQCYISERLFGRSANGGKCVQFCRHAFSLYTQDGQQLAENQYLLSLGDLDLSRHLRALLDSGVRSLKIEGRLKDIRYVKNVTAAYRHALDRLLEEGSSQQTYSKASSGKCTFSFHPDPARSFQRQPIDYFLHGRKEKRASLGSPKALGPAVAVVDVHDTRTQGAFTLRPCPAQGKQEKQKALHNGDGLCFFDQRGVLQGLKVNSVLGQKIVTRSRPLPAPGTILYRNYDHHFSRILDQSSACRTIALSMKIQVKEQQISLHICDEDGIESSTRMDIEGAELARNPEKTKEMLARQMKKTGESIFQVKEITVDYQDGIFIAASLCNALRRKGLHQHEEQRLCKYNQGKRRHSDRHNMNSIKKAFSPDAPWLALETTWRDNIINEKARAFYQRHGVEKFRDLGRERLSAMDAGLMSTRYCVRQELGICPRYNPESRQDAGQAEPLLLKDKKHTVELVFDCHRCGMTVRTVQKANDTESD